MTSNTISDKEFTVFLNRKKINNKKLDELIKNNQSFNDTHIKLFTNYMVNLFKDIPKEYKYINCKKGMAIRKERTANKKKLVTLTPICKSYYVTIIDYLNCGKQVDNELFELMIELFINFELYYGKVIEIINKLFVYDNIATVDNLKKIMKFKLFKYLKETDICKLTCIKNKFNDNNVSFDDIYDIIYNELISRTKMNKSILITFKTGYLI